MLEVNQFQILNDLRGFCVAVLGSLDRKHAKVLALLIWLLDLLAVELTLQVRLEFSPLKLTTGNRVLPAAAKIQQGLLLVADVRPFNLAVELDRSDGGDLLEAHGRARGAGALA